MDFRLRRLTPDDAAAFRDIRLEALQTHPEAFGAEFEAEAQRSLEDWQKNIATKTFFTAETEGKLIGMVAFVRHSGRKVEHSGKIISMYVRPDVQAHGVGAALLTMALDYAKTLVEQVFLCCVTQNEKAFRFYKRHGFVVYGTEPRVLKIGETYYDEYLMVKDLRA